MNRRLLSTTISLTALLALGSFSLTTASRAAGSAAQPFRTLPVTGLVLNQGLDPDGEYNQGVTDYGNGNVDSAIQHFTNAIKGRSNFSDAYFNRGLCYEQKKEFKLAIADFTKVITAHPKLYDAYVERAATYSRSGDFADAKSDFSTAIGLKPSNPSAFMERGDSEIEQKQYDSAVGDYTKYFELEPKPDPTVYLNRGVANYDAGHFDAAIADFKKFIQSDPNPKDTVGAYLSLGNAYIQKMDYAGAIEAYTKYIAENPNDQTGVALKSRGLAYLESKQYELAIKDYKAYLILKPNDPDASQNVIVAEQKAGVDVSHDLELQVAKEPTNLSLRRVLGDTYLKSKSYAKAIEQYDVVLAAKPDDAPVRYNRGVAELGLGANDKAAADLAMEVKENPTDADGWDNLGVALGKQGDWKGAIDAFTHYVNLKPDDISAYHDRGIAEYNMKDYTAAAADLNKYNVAKPGDPEVSRLISDMLLNGAHPEQAIAMIQSQLAKNPKDGLLWFNLGVAQVTTKDYTSAVGSFTHAIELKRDEVTLYNRGFAYYNLGQAGNAAAYPKAEADAAAALALKPAYPEALLLKADAEFADKTPGKMQAAIADYKAYAQMSGLTPDAKKYAQQQALRGAIALKDYAAVVAGATDLIETDPNEASNYLIRGSAYLAQMNYDAAIPDLVKYTTLKSDDATGFYNLGLAYYNKKDNANAGTAFEKALQLKPNYYDAAFQAGVAYQALATADQSDLNKAKPEFEKAVADYEAAAKAGTGKNAADALYNEATTLELEGKAADSVDPLKLAVPVWERYIAAAPNDPELPKIKAHVEALKTQIANG